MGVRARTEQELLDYILTNATRNEHGCLISHLKPNAKGYVPLSLGGRNGKKLRAHRFVYEMLCEELFRDEMALHTCDTRNCIELKHLFKGDAQDNTDDMMAKGRNRNQNSAKVAGYVE